jgi:septum formation protein
LDKARFNSALDYVRATCLGKLEALTPPSSSEVIQIACDTVVVRPDGAILEKPADAEEAFKMISSLFGKRIKVISVVHLRSSNSRIKCFHEESELIMRTREEISDDEIKGYLEEVNYKYKFMY